MLTVRPYFFIFYICFAIGETIPIRLFLGGFDLTPTFREVNKKFSTRYYLSLVLIDEGKSNVSFNSEFLTYSLLSYITNRSIELIFPNSCFHTFNVTDYSTRCTPIFQTIGNRFI